MESLAKPQKQSWLSWFSRGLLILVGLIFIGRLVELQVIKGNYFRALAEGNRIKKVPIRAARGKILARGGETLVGNSEIKVEVSFDPESGYEKKKIEVNKSGEDLITEWERNYLIGSEAAHITGYLSEVNEKEVGKVDPHCPEKGPKKLASMTGRGGLEEVYDCKLRGFDGEELVEVDTFGDKVRVLGRRTPTAGENLHTTIDLNLQEKVVEVMKRQIKVGADSVIPANKLGAVVATDTSGEVLVLYSSSSFDPGKIKPELFSDPGLPFFNRAIAGSYHPGSIFKIVTATAALEEGKIDDSYRYTDPGVITVNEFSYKNWYFSQYGGTEGEIDLVRAIARSVDTFFYKLGEFVGPDNLAAWSKKFGLGQKTGIDLPNETGGLVPNPDWKEKTKGERWFLGNTYHMAIGQGDIELTPLQANLLTSVVASDGLLCKPHLIRKENSDCVKLDLKKETLGLIKKGMVAACLPGGTAFPFFDFQPQVACKTGTAETNEVNKTHAWFTVFAPVDDPEIVLTVLIEKGGEGSYVAAPIAKEILKYYFESRQ